MLHEAPVGLNEALLHAGERPVVDPLRQHQPPPQIPEIAGQHAQLETHFIGAKPTPGSRWPACGSADYEKLVIYVRASNTDAQAFYSGLGFLPCGRLARQVKIAGKDDDEIVMEMFL